jgi:eukaryotic-like serine/threonine-protein kinase
MGTSSASADGGDGVLPSGVRHLEADDPKEFGGYRLVGRLGSGGMGVVYLGRDPLGGLVAVKAAHGAMAGDDELRRRFAAEAASVRRVPATCTARLLVDGTDRLRPYIVTEYVEGRSLEQIVPTGGPLEPEQLRALAAGVGRALTAIHRAGLVHRDLKPANILLTLTGPRVIDFGIAQTVDASGGPTGPGMVVGSPGWIAPERLHRRPATPASDVFGWGCLVAYAGTGRNPFGEGDVDELAQRIMYAPPDLEGLDDSVRGPVASALAKDPAERPAADELLGLLGSTPPDGHSGTKELPAGRRRRWAALAPASVALTAAAVLAAVIVTTAADHGSPRVPPASRSSATPPGNQAATHGAPVRPRAAHATAPRHAPAATHAAEPGAGATTPVNGRAKVKPKQKGKGKGKGGPGHPAE